MSGSSHYSSIVLVRSPVDCMMTVSEKVEWRRCSRQAIGSLPPKCVCWSTAHIMDMILPDWWLDDRLDDRRGVVHAHDSSSRSRLTETYVVMSWRCPMLSTTVLRNALMTQFLLVKRHTVPADFLTSEGTRVQVVGSMNMGHVSDTHQDSNSHTWITVQVRCLTPLSSQLRHWPNDPTDAEEWTPLSQYCILRL